MQTDDKNSSVSYKLANARLDALRKNSQNILLESDAQAKKDDIFAKLKIAIENALFIEKERKVMWLNALDKIDTKKAQELLNAILRENLRYKKGIRKLKFKKIPERVSEEATGDI